MAASTATSQVMARLRLPERAEYEYIASLNDVSLSELMRQSLEFAKEHFRKIGEQEAKKRAELPHGVTQLEEDQALDRLIISLNNGEEIRFKLRDAFTPTSKALFRLLQIVWAEEHTDASREVLNRVAGKVAGLLESDPPPATTAVPDIRSRPRRQG